MTALRVGLTIETTGPGGAETMILGLAGELRDRGHEVVAIVPSVEERWLYDRFGELGFARESIPLGGPIHLPTIRRLMGIISSHRLDLVHSHEFTLAVNGAAACRAAGRPHVITMHGGLYFSQRMRRRIALKVAVALSHSTVTVSSFSRQVVAGHLSLPPSKLEVIHNGVMPAVGDGTRVRRELGLGSEDVLIVAVGNLYPVKGHRFLLEAVGRLPRPGSGRVLAAIAGRGELEADLTELAHGRGIESSVRLLGFRGDVPDLLAAADIFAMPSLSEGLPMAVLEAMFAGKPIVASRVGGMPELLEDGVHGLLVPPQDVEALEAALSRLVSDADLRHRLGIAAKARAEGHFSVEVMGARYLETYRAALRG